MTFSGNHRRCKLPAAQARWQRTSCSALALTYLERYSLPNTLYTLLRLAQCERVLLPGQKIRLIYHHGVAGWVHVISVDQGLFFSGPR